MISSPGQDFALGTLEDHRRRLLDLGARNNLLNFAHDRHGSVRISDEPPNRLHAMLLSGEELGFQAIPDPTREQLIEAGYIQDDPQTGQAHPIKAPPSAMEWARVLGYAANHRLPQPHEEGGRRESAAGKPLQILMFDSEMERRLSGLYRRAETAVEEMGSNLCYVALGFLEWLDAKDGGKGRHAPLLLVPVRLARGPEDRAGGSRSYSVTFTGEEVIPNPVLREKLRHDFGLPLPDLGDALTPEDYFSEIERLIAAPQPLWEVRRQTTFALFNFRKLLIYLDLDPMRWPGEKMITRHPIASRFLLPAGEREHGAEPAEDQVIDDFPDAQQRYPIVVDADSSQHSALVEVRDGENLVIEGPPGTGKSQTITNLIAAALARGQRVLFMAEKLAALKVVKRQLDRAGLGDFCLELHSHTAGKALVLDALVSRLAKQSQYQRPRRIKVDIEEYETLKNRLRSYAELVNRGWKETGETIHQILMAACRYREELEIDPAALHPQGYDGRLPMAEAQPRSLEQVHNLADGCRRLANQLDPGEPLDHHPWYGVGNPDLQAFDQERVCAALSRWQDALTALADTLKSVAYRLGAEAETANRQAPNAFAAIESLRADLQNPPPLRGDEALSALHLLRDDNLAMLTRHVRILQQIRRHRAALPGPLRPELAEDAKAHERLRRAYRALEALGVAGATDQRTLAKHLKRIKRLQKEFHNLDKLMTRAALLFGEPYTALIDMNEAGFKEFRGLVELGCRIRPELLGLRHPRFDHDHMDPLLLELKSRLEKLDGLGRSLAQHFALDRLPSTQTVEEMRKQLENRELLGWRSEQWRNARTALLQISSKPDAGVKELVGHLKELYVYVKGKQLLEDSTGYLKALGAPFAGMETPIDDLLELRRWYSDVRRRYGLGVGPKVALGDAVIGMDPSVAEWFRTLSERGAVVWLDGLLGELSRLQRAFPSYRPLHSWRTPLLTADGPLEQLRQLLESSLECCRELLRSPQVSLAEIGDTVDCLSDLDALQRERKESAPDPGWLGHRYDPEVEPERLSSETLLMLEHTEALARFIAEEITTAPLQDAIRKDPGNRLFAELEGELTDAWRTQLEQRRQFADLTQLDVEAWEHGGGGTLDGLLARNRRALEKADWMTDWLDYVRIRRQLDSAGFTPLTRAMEQGRIALADIEAGYRLGVYDFLAQQILAVFPDMSGFTGEDLLELQEQFGQCDLRLQQLQRQRLVWEASRNRIPKGKAGQRPGDQTELALLRQQCAQKNRHMPLRQLLVRAGNAVAALKPCFMMSPTAIAQYLTPGEMEFDLVIMDEASQIRPEEALGAIARGRQLVVVGDPKQLPPTSFFAKGIDEEEEENTSAIAITESILDSAKLRLPVRPLRWHHRSLHESLIAFPNRAFYDNRLTLFPSPLKEVPGLGLKLTRIPRGRLENRRNQEEARIVALAIQHHLLKRPQESLGIVAMSTEQCDQIADAVEALKKNNQQLWQALEKESTKREPLFIKSLENVQGDTRDLIFISCTYAAQKSGGKLQQGFGPLNSDAGWRQLNVMITRARRRMHLFSSVGSEEIEVSVRSRNNTLALKGLLAFAETGRLPQSSDPNQSPLTDFQTTVMAALARAGFQCTPGVGVAGCFIDLAVRDPDNPNRYLLGIESDGAGYVCAKSVRDRDRLRQAVLQRLGWRLHRIWSMDWYNDPHAQIELIVGKLKELKSKPLGK